MMSKQEEQQVHEDALHTDAEEATEEVVAATEVLDEEETKKEKKQRKKDKQAEELATLQARNKELEDALLREKAEVENFKRRMKQEYDTNLKFSNQVFIENMLPVLDSFDRALSGTEQASQEVQNFVKGVEMIQKLFSEVLANEGLEVIDTKDQTFDPYIHQAVLKEYDAEKEDNIILDELQKGYRLKDRILRASMVKVNGND